MFEDRGVRITVSPAGKVKVEAQGFNGEGCAAATSAFESALTQPGNSTREYKPEWSNPTSAEQGEEQGMSW